MTQEHPITPPPELVKQWEGTAYNAAPIPYTHHIARCAARWGADKELEACVEWVGGISGKYGPRLRLSRRPKPPSLKEQALETLNYPKDFWSEAEVDTIRRALDALPE